MDVRVRLFAQMRIDAGTDLLRLELPEGATVETALSELQSRHPELSRHLGSCMLAVGLDYVGHDHPLQDADELTLVPPVQGG
jgi:molybdopterin converting factor small subunit